MEKYFLKFIAGVALGLCLLYWFFYQLDWALVLQTLQAADLRLIGLSMILLVCTYVLRSLRWQMLLGPQNRCRWSSIFRATVLGFAAIFFVGRVGEFVRPFSLCRREPVRLADSLASILIERLFDTVMVVALFGAGLLVFDATGMPAEHMLLGLRLLSAGLIAASILGIFGLMIYQRRSSGALSVLKRKLARWPHRLAEPLLSLLESIADGLAILVDRRTLLFTLGLTLFQWGLVVSLYWLTIAAFDLRLSVSQAIFVLGFAMLGSVLPTPGGSAGAFHAAAAGSLILLGLEWNRAAGIAIVLHLVTFGPAVTIGLYHAIRYGHGVLWAIRPQDAEPVCGELDVEANSILSPELESLSPYHSQLPRDAGQRLNL